MGGSWGIYVCTYTYTHIYVSILKYIKNHQFKSIPLISIQHHRVYSSFDSPSILAILFSNNSKLPWSTLYWTNPLITIPLPLPTHKCPHLSKTLIPNSQPLLPPLPYTISSPCPGSCAPKGYHLFASVLTSTLVGFTWWMLKKVEGKEAPIFSLQGMYLKGKDWITGMVFHLSFVMKNRCINSTVH